MDVDIVIDERTCVIFVPLVQLSQTDGPFAISDFLINTVCHAYQHCWLVLESDVCRYEKINWLGVLIKIIEKKKSVTGVRHTH